MVLNQLLHLTDKNLNDLNIIQLNEFNSLFSLQQKEMLALLVPTVYRFDI